MDSINMIGYDAVHPSDFVYDMPGGHGYYLLILTHTPLRFRDSDGERIYPARHAALFSPDARIHYGACEATYSNDWIIFDSDEPYVTQFPLQNRPFPVPDADYCHNLFQLLTWEHMQGGLEALPHPIQTACAVVLSRIGGQGHAQRTVSTKAMPPMARDVLNMI